MKILLLNPPDQETIPEFPDEDGNSYIDTEDFGFFPPLGLLYVLSSIEKARPQHEYFFKDAVAERYDYKKLGKYFEELQPDIVGITSFTISLVDILKTAELIRETCGENVKIVLGGHHPIAFPFEA
ncbi:MAG: cobalamin-dependent protein, partial [SAR324 cluster bacterium]|nr:cobalamin-dependent protein [SAR324 cluster bacterium]